MEGTSNQTLSTSFLGHTAGKPPAGSMTIMVDDFLDTLKLKLYSFNTILAYSEALKEYENLCAETKLQWNSKEAAIKYIRLLVNKSYSANTINLRISALSSFIDWCIDNDYTLRNYFKKNKVKTPKRLVEYLDDKTVNLLLSIVKDKLKPYIEVMLFGGLRISEAVSVSGQNFYEDGNTIYCRVIGKGNKERITPLLMDIEDARKFLKFKKNDKVTAASIKEYLYRLSAKSGRHITAHRLRHTFATKASSMGVPIDVISKWLGHEDLRTTMVYAEVTYAKIKEHASATRLTF